ncbi:ATPase [Pseudomonas sp. ACN5]|uniref:ATPase n=1 Tax=Pseudomonas sp. ACN5 TaxID=1920427 RepID=UPI000BB2D7BC|nr:ATPase [Pseudomonas sp. ACN5]PBJ01014.1 hypothetical protein BSF40_54730 [Pseudomonas sp. ACN5]
MSQAETPAAENRISRKDPVVVAYYQSAQCYYRPETEELIFIGDDHASQFETHWRDMSFRMDEFHRASANYSTALEHYAGASAKAALPPSEEEHRRKALAAAEHELEKNRAALKQQLGDFSLTSMSYDEVVELIPVVQANNGRNGKSKPYAYVKKGYLSQSQAGRKLHSVSLKGKDKRSAKGSIFSKDKNGNTRISTTQLAEQLTALEWPKIKLELKDVLKWTGSDFDLDKLKNDCVLFDWAESWEHSLKSEPTQLSANVDMSHGAQFMRFASNVGASAEFDVDKGNVALKGEAKAALTLASGKVNFTAYVPDRLGWALRYTHSNGNDFNMGLLRLCLTPELTGFVGASVQIEGQLQIARSGDQQVLVGQPGGRLPRFSERKTRGAVFHQQMAAEDEGLTLNAQAFAGARVEGSLKGSLQWLKPTPPSDLNPKVAGLLQSTGKYTDFCSIGSSIAGLAGAGAGGKFYCTFINGRFCFHVAASLCWGVGARGGVICEVGTNTIAEFGAWLIYQLYRLDYGFFDLVNKGAFIAYGQYCVMQMESVKHNIYAAFEKSVWSIESVGLEFDAFIRSVVSENKGKLEASRRRNQLAKNIINQPSQLLLHTPEAKGILLYVLTRHGVWDHLDFENRGDGFIPDIYSDRKNAVIWVLKSIQTISEWNKIMCRMTPDGESLASDNDAALVVKQQEQHLVNFLQEGINRDQDMYKAKDELAVIYKNLKAEVAWGYALAMNDTVYYRLNSVSNSHYPARCAFGPYEDHSTHLA